MAKAQVTTPAGISVKVEGTPEEILAVVEDLERKQKEQRTQPPAAQKPKARVGRLTLTSLLESMRDEDFFRLPRDLGSILLELEAKGHFFPVTTLSGAVLGQVRKRNLRRIRKDGRWTYVRS